MIIPRSRYVSVTSLSGWKKMAYWEWGDPDNEDVVICVHGLTRNSRDFDALAQVLARDFRVIAPDIVGRGKSDWLGTPEEYSYTRYVLDASVLIARAQVARVHWVGTSMGGIIGMMLDAGQNAPLKSLVLNDVGARIPAASLRDLSLYVGKAPSFASLEEVRDYLAQIHAPFGHLPQSYWDHMAMTSVRWEDPVYRLHYDPAIGTVFNSALFDIDLTPFWLAGQSPTLLIRGGDSALFPDAVREEMVKTRPGTQSITFPGIGHAPSLVEPEQMEAIYQFLLSQRHQG